MGRTKISEDVHSVRLLLTDFEKSGGESTLTYVGVEKE